VEARSGKGGVSRCRLYLITPPVLEPKQFAPALEAAMTAGDVASVQLRVKNIGDDAVLHAGRILMPIVQRAGAAFIVNDRPDLVAALGADGVHIGQDDASYADTRALLGKDRIVGVTCHSSRHLAIEAAEQGADYVAFGAMFPTSTKEAKTRCEVELIQWWAEMMVVPCVAIGGITVDNCRPVIEAGADFLAVASGVWDFPEGPAAAVRAFNRLTAQS
jgi:thiamine-phosphate pyrophosphorylase